jgi:hypothetical protein
MAKRRAAPIRSRGRVPEEGDGDGDGDDGEVAVDMGVGEEGGGTDETTEAEGQRF